MGNACNSQNEFGIINLFNSFDEPLINLPTNEN